MSEKPGFGCEDCGDVRASSQIRVLANARQDTIREQAKKGVQ